MNTNDLLLEDDKKKLEARIRKTYSEAIIHALEDRHALHENREQIRISLKGLVMLQIAIAVCSSLLTWTICVAMTAPATAKIAPIVSKVQTPPPVRVSVDPKTKKRKVTIDPRSRF